MPIYDYECRNCGHRVEVVHGVNHPGPTACERCGGTLRKLISPPAFVFRGSGWAKKDRSARPAAKAGAAAETGDGSDASAGAEPTAKSAEKAGAGGKSSEGAGTATKKGSSAASPAD